MNVSTPIATFFFTIAVFLVVVATDTALQAMVRFAFKKRILAFETASFLLLILGGMYVLYANIPVLDLLLGAFGLWAIATLNYMQCKSFFSRGYSIRILVDLYERGKPSTVATMKAEYAGMGLNYMMKKRMQSVGALGIAHVNETHVGPLKPAGRGFAMLGRFFRRLLRLEHVG